MARRDIVVIGGSIGGFQALRTIVAGLPPDFGAALFVVLHVGDRPSRLPELLSASGPLPAHHAEDGEPIEEGRIYVAPPDRHLLISRRRIRLSRAPRENWARPAVDPLFRSAAAAYGPQVIGVVLSGALNDGTDGISTIKRHGGVAVVQDPADALDPGMPQSVLDHTSIDHCVPAAEIAGLLTRLTREEVALPRRGDGEEVPSPPSSIPQSVMASEYETEAPAALICPECGGAMRESSLGTLDYYTCHLGHRFAAPNLSVAQFRQVEQAIEIALRTLGERAELCRRIAERARAGGRSRSAEHWDRARRQAEEHIGVLQRFLKEDWVQPGEETSAEERTGHC
ncbi:MAG TPA: chemotaxis protein CheB [Stellaceae bacterium]|nr:chemotaxis protein CheB [Stellaceae bacterium]